MLARRKRQLTLHGADIEPDDPQPAKGVAAAQELEAVNTKLRKLAADAFTFIEREELVYQAAASIKKAMFARPNGKGLEIQPASMLSRISDIHDSLAKATEDQKGALTTADNISKRAVPLFHEIRTTSLTSAEPRRLEFAYKPAIELQHLSYAYPSSYGEGDGDLIASNLLIALANERKAAGEMWDY